ncbi:MAG: hypothetical protein QM791_03985 [Ferruginibacter sp.]
MILLEQADTLEILLPFAYNPATEKTFYNQLKGAGLKTTIRNEVIMYIVDFEST